MARQRDYAAEYAARQERAREHGFESYAAERAYRSETKWEREIAGTSTEWQERHPGDWRNANPEQLNAYYENVLVPMMSGTVTNMDRHNAVQYFVDYEDMTVEEAIAAMREILGESEEAG
jgi:hypothetical protein